MKNCIICNKKTKDPSDLFCPKCRKLDWEIRFKAIRGLERQKKKSWKTKVNMKKRKPNQSTGNMYLKTYWQRRREET